MSSIVRGVVVMLGIAGILLVFIFDYTTRTKKLDIFLLGIEQAGLNVVNFIPKGEYEFRGVEFSYRGVLRIKLPAKTVRLNLLEEFISKAEEHNQDTIYKHLSGSPWGVTIFYVYSQDKSIAWSYFVG